MTNAIKVETATHTSESGKDLTIKTVWDVYAQTFITRVRHGSSVVDTYKHNPSCGYTLTTAHDAGVARCKRGW